MNASPKDPWVVFDYECDQFHAMCQLLVHGNTEHAGLPHYVRNAVVESALLHTRILADLFLSKGTKPDDIHLSGLLPTFASQKLTQLEIQYGDSHTEDTPCWTINKMLAHPTSWRSSEYNYTDLLNQVFPLISAVIQEVNEQRT